MNPQWIERTTYRLGNTTLEVIPSFGELYYVVDSRDPETALSGALTLEGAKAFAVRLAAGRGELAHRGGML